jgi:hypothetical protein
MSVFLHYVVRLSFKTLILFFSLLVIYQCGDFLKHHYGNISQYCHVRGIVESEGKRLLRVDQLHTYLTLPLRMQNKARQFSHDKTILWLVENQTYLVNPEDVIGPVKV